MFDKISFDVQLQILNVTWRFQKQKWMLIDIYILFWKVTAMSHV